MIVEAKNMKTEELIGALVELDKQGKENRALTNAYKAELQARGISIMDDHNVKYVKFYGDAGSASITDSMSLDILNPDKLKKLIGEGVWNTKVKESTETKYKYDGKFEKMLKASFMPGVVKQASAGNIDYTMGTASMLGHYEALGYICMGVLAFALGVCVTVLLYRLRRVEEHKRRTKEYQHRMETDGQPEKKEQQEKEREEREREQR